MGLEVKNSENKNKRIVEMRMAGMTRAEVADKLGVSIHRVTRASKGKLSDYQPQDALDERNKAMSARYADGEYEGDLAKEYGITTTRLKEIVRAVNGSSRHRPGMDAKILKMRKEGVSREQVAEEFRVSPEYITKLTNSTLGSAKERAAERVKRNAEIERMFLAGKSCAEIARHFDLSAAFIGTVVRHLKKENRDTPWAWIDADELRELREQGYSVPELAEHFGARAYHIRNRCAELQIPANVDRSRLSNGPKGESDWKSGAAKGSKKLLKALMQFHPERCFVNACSRA